MGVYNRLRIEGLCQNCGEQVSRTLQFKFGYCQLFDFVVGNSVSWATDRRGRSINYGQPVVGRAWVPAYAEEPCPVCLIDFDLAEFAVVIEGSQIVATVQATVGFHFPEDREVVDLPSSEDQPEPVSDV